MGNVQAAEPKKQDSKDSVEDSRDCTVCSSKDRMVSASQGEDASKPQVPRAFPDVHFTPLSKSLFLQTRGRSSECRSAMLTCTRSAH